MSRAMLAAAVLLSACSTAALGAQATLGPTCEPADLAPLLLTVPDSSGDYPQLRIWVFSLPAENTTLSAPAPGGEQFPNAAWCTTERNCQAPASATVTFGKTHADRSVDFTVDARLADGARFTAARRARWKAAPSIECG